MICELTILICGAGYMRVKDNYKHGQHLQICDRSGFKVHSGDTRREWNHSVVRKEDFEHRQPQDFVRGVRDVQSVPDPRPGAPDLSTQNTTTLDAAELAGQTVLSVTSTSSMAVGNSILVALDNSTFHLSTISSFVVDDTVTIADAIPYKAASGSEVVVVSAPTSEADL